MKYIFFSDIDGTIYDHEQKVLPSTINDVIFAKKHNVEFVFATGNGYFNSIKDLAKKMNVRYLILSNGAHIFDNHTKTTLYSCFIVKDLAQKVLDIGIKFNLSIMWWNENEVYISEQSKLKAIEKFKKFINHDYICLTNYVKNDILKIEFTGEKNAIDKTIKLLKELPLNIVRMDSTHLEIINQNVSKGTVVTKFCQLFNVSLQNVGAIGDSPNDLEMLSIVGHSYAMINGHPEVLKTAKYHAEHVLDNGVGQALNDFINKIK